MNNTDQTEKALSAQDIQALEGAFRESPIWKFTQNDQAAYYAIPTGLSVDPNSPHLPYMQQLHVDLLEAKEALLDSHDNLMQHKSVASLFKDMSSPAANNQAQKSEMLAELKHMMDSKEYGPAFRELSQNFQGFVSRFSHYSSQASDTIEAMPIQMEDKASRIDDLKTFTDKLGQEVKPYLTHMYTEDKSFLMSDQLSGAMALSETKMNAVLYKNKIPQPTNRPEFEGP